MLGYLSQGYSRPRVVVRRRSGLSPPPPPPPAPVSRYPNYGGAKSKASARPPVKPQQSAKYFPPPPMKPAVSAHQNRPPPLPAEYYPVKNDPSSLTEIVSVLCESVSQWQEATDAHLRALRRDVDFIKQELAR